MLISIKKIFVITLMSALTSGVFAQTSTTKKSEVIKIEKRDSIYIQKSVASNKYLDEDDIDMIQSLLHHHNTPIEGCIAEDEVIISSSKANDDWKAFISSHDGTYYLSYVVSRGGKFVGRIDIRIN